MSFGNGFNKCKNTKLKVIMNNMNKKKQRKGKCCTLQNPMQISRIRINTNCLKTNKPKKETNHKEKKKKIKQSKNTCSCSFLQYK